MKSILIVDDSPEIRKTVRSTFESEDGFNICAEAVDGQDAIQKAQQFKPDLIILDLSMPVMNGIEAASALRLLMPSVSLILFTLHDRVITVSEARAAGFSSVVSKEQGMDVLVSQARAVLGLLPIAKAELL